MNLKGRQYRSVESLKEYHENGWHTFTNVKVDNCDKVGKLANSQRKARGNEAKQRVEANVLNSVQISMMDIRPNELTRKQRKAFNAAKRAGNLSEFKKRFFSGQSVLIRY